MISIHALRVEGDVLLPAPNSKPAYFYPRPPGGGRRARNGYYQTDGAFLSTPSGWRATYNADRMGLTTDISIHALRVEGDASLSRQIYESKRFLSTPSGWRATVGWEDAARTLEFLSTPSGWRATSAIVRSPIPDFPISIHALRVEGDRVALYGRRCWIISIHALRVEGDDTYAEASTGNPISIHALRVEGDG